MQKNKIEHLMPDYMDKFICSGAECNDNCCYGWRISIDKATYKKYKKIREKNLKSKVDEFIKINNNATNNMEYAYISLNENGICPFLEESKLCYIHKRMGPNYLSVTCKSYPRTENGVENGANKSVERSLMLSCPDAAKLVLLNSKIMEFNKDERIYNGTYLNKVINIDIDENKSSINKYFWELRIFTITLLQNRNYKFQDRLIILGLFYNKLQSYIDSNNIHLTSQLIEEYEKMIKNKELDNIFLDISEKNVILQLKFAVELIEIKNSYGVANDKYLENIIKFSEGLKISDDIKIEDMINEYKNAFEKYYTPYMNGREYIFENYFVNYLFRTLYPYVDEGKNIFRKYILLVVHYVIFKTALIGITAYEKELNDNLLIDIIYSFEREMEHNIEYLDDVMKILEVNNFNTLSHMVMLIKD